MVIKTTSSPPKEATSITIPEQAEERTPPPPSERRKIFMDKLYSVSKMHVDEAGADGNDRKKVCQSGFSMDTSNSLASTLYEPEPDTSQKSPAPPTKQSQQSKDGLQRHVQEKTSSKPIVQYMIDLAEMTKLECGGACRAVQGQCEYISTRTPIASLDASRYLANRSAEDDETFTVESLYTTFDDTFEDETAQNTDTTGPVRATRGDPHSRFDDSTTISTQNGAWW
jgi:hypothetical protein